MARGDHRETFGQCSGQGRLSNSESDFLFSFEESLRFQLALLHSQGREGDNNAPGRDRVRWASDSREACRLGDRLNEREKLRMRRGPNERRPPSTSKPRTVVHAIGVRLPSSGAVICDYEIAPVRILRAA